MSVMYEPSVCVIAQGAKRVVLGEESYVYDPRHFLITSVELPTVVQIIKASREKPCLGLMLKLDQRLMSQLMVDSKLPPPRPQQSSRATADVNGSITPLGTITVNKGASETFTITPNPGYTVRSVIVDGSNRGAITSFTFTNITANHTVNAYFQ